MLRKKILHSSMLGKKFYLQSQVTHTRLKTQRVGPYFNKKFSSSGGYICYINTNEIPGEFSRENLISSHVKITCYLHMWKYHRCLGYIINRVFHTKKTVKVKWFGSSLVFSIINRTLHGRLEIRNSLLVLKRNFVSPSGHLISSI